MPGAALDRAVPEAVLRDGVDAQVPAEVMEIGGGGPALSMFRDRQWQEVPVWPDDWTASVQASVTAYLEAVIAGREPPVPGAVALETVRLLERIYDTAAVLPGPPDHRS